MGILLICYSSDTYDLEEYETETVGLPRHTLMSAAAGLAGMAAPNAYHAGVIFFNFSKSLVKHENSAYGTIYVSCNGFSAFRFATPKRADVYDVSPTDKIGHR